jgi:hypothetical protein
VKAAAQDERNERRENRDDDDPNGSSHRFFDLLDVTPDVGLISFEDRHAMFQISDRPVHSFHFHPSDFTHGNAPKSRFFLHRFYRQIVLGLS